LAALLALGAGALAFASAAEAASLSVVNTQGWTQLRITAAAGETNTVAIWYLASTDEYRIADRGAGAITASTGCRALPGTPEAACRAQGINWIYVDLLDRDDTFSATSLSIRRTVLGGAGSDTLRDGGGSPGAWFEGGDGADFLYGGGNADVLYGGSGNDQLEGAGGGDLLYGDAGADILIGGAPSGLNSAGDADWLDGGSGRDFARYYFTHRRWGVHVTLDGKANDGELCACDANGDGLRDSEGDNVTGVEWVEGTRFNDVLHGNAYANTLSGEDGNDTIRGLGGNDELWGDSGIDSLYGDDGNDTLWADDGARDRRVDGGRGEDVGDGDRTDVPAAFSIEGGSLYGYLLECLAAPAVGIVPAWCF
jgi:Ca2+-binding RTX toxin-like protein